MNDLDKCLEVVLGHSFIHFYSLKKLTYATNMTNIKSKQQRVKKDTVHTIVISTIASHSPKPLNISETIRNRGLVPIPKDHQ